MHSLSWNAASRRCPARGWAQPRGAHRSLRDLAHEDLGRRARPIAAHASSARHGSPSSTPSCCEQSDRLPGRGRAHVLRAVRVRRLPSHRGQRPVGVGTHRPTDARTRLLRRARHVDLIAARDDFERPIARLSGTSRASQREMQCGVQVSWRNASTASTRRCPVSFGASPSLPKIDEMCFSTAPSLTTNAAAIAPLERP